MAGRGRCGTNQLVRILGEHPEVWSLGEARFLVDGGGLEDLVHALTVAYPAFHTADAARSTWQYPPRVLACRLRASVIRNQQFMRFGVAPARM